MKTPLYEVNYIGEKGEMPVRQIFEWKERQREEFVLLFFFLGGGGGGAGGRGRGVGGGRGKVYLFRLGLLGMVRCGLFDNKLGTDCSALRNVVPLAAAKVILLPLCFFFFSLFFLGGGVGELFPP